MRVYRWRYFGNFLSKFVGVLDLEFYLHIFQSFAYIVIVEPHSAQCYFSRLFKPMSKLYCCTVNLSHHNYFLANKNVLFYWCLFVFIIKRTLHGSFKIRILFSCGKNNILLTCCTRSSNTVLPLENKIHILAPPCNILYIPQNSQK